MSLFDGGKENDRVSGLTGRTAAPRDAGLVVCVRGGEERAYLKGRGLDVPLSTSTFEKLLDIAIDRGSASIRQKKPNLKSASARLAYFSASGWLCDGRCARCLERELLRSLLDGATLAEFEDGKAAR